jgi:drug/metabolite transporter (DMT)-like permease
MSSRIVTAPQAAAGAQPLTRRSFAIGVAAALMAAVASGTWIVITRLGVTTTLSPFDTAFLRFAIPAVILLPVLLREGLALRRIGAGRMALMAMGSGLPFFLVSAAGMQLAPAAHAGALLPGGIPLFVTALAVIFERDRLRGWRAVGFALIVAGVIAIGGYNLFLGAPGQWRGHLLFLAGAALWSVYTLVFRRVGIGAWHGTALVSFYSTLVLIPIYVLVGSRLPNTPWPELALQVSFQGVIAGVLAVSAYAAAIRRLGSARAAAFMALTPAVAALVAIPALGEWPDAATTVGIVAVSLGVALASGALGQGWRFSASASRTS